MQSILPAAALAADVLLLAVAIGAVVFGLLRLRRHPSRLTGWLLPTALLTVALAGWLGVRAVAAQQHLAQARSSLATARTALLDRRLDDAAVAMRSASSDTSAARRLTGDPTWTAAGAVPWLGRTFRSVRSLTTTADDVARQVLPPTMQAAQALTGDELRTPDGDLDLAPVLRAGPAVTAAGRHVQALDDGLAALPASGVLPVVRTATAQLRAQLGELSTAVAHARTVLDLAPPLLGSDRPRRYFVLVQQPGESRGTGGLTGGFAVLEADQGRVRVTQAGSNADLVKGVVPVPPGVSAEYAYEYGGNRAFELWQNVNLSPDLPSVARVVAARWKAQSGQDIDGVIAMDPTATADLLRGTGAVDVGGGKLVEPGALVRYLTVDQYAGLAVDGQAARKDALASIARSAAERLIGRGGLDQLVTGLTAAVRSGHLRMASDDPALGPGLAAAGVDGALPVGDAPVAYAVVQNATQGKLDSFLDRHVTYAAGACAGVMRDSTLTVELRNDAPASGLPAYLTIRNRDGRSTSSTDSAVVLQTYATRGAQLVSIDVDGAPVPDAAGLHDGLEAGLPFWSLFVDLPRDVTRVVTLHLREPVVAGAVRMPEQPLVRPLQRTVTAPTC